MFQIQAWQTSEDGESQEDTRNFSFDHSYWSCDPSDSHFISQEKVFEDLGVEVLDNSIFFF